MKKPLGMTMLAGTLALMTATLQAATPVVSNVTATQRAGTQLVDISYDVADADNHPLTISVSLQSGSTTLPATTLTGAVGAGIMPGNNKLITWDAGTDWLGHYAVNITATVTADDGHVPLIPFPTALYVVIDLSGGPSAASYPVTTLTAVPTGGWTDEYKTTKLVLRKIPQGTFMMGSPEDELERFDNETQHQVTLTQDFYMGVFQVTQKQWERVMGTDPSYYKGDARPERVSYDMIRGSTAESINWPDTGSSVKADTFLGRIRARTGLVFDLPTEAQWEYACRAGTTTALNSGKNLTDRYECPNMAEVGRYYYNSGYSSSYPSDGKGGYTDAHTKAGMYLPNNWGLYDMHGNVWEWCLDWGIGSYGTSALTDPKGPVSGSYRIRRGGSYSIYAYNCRSAYRYYGNPIISFSSDVGFRVCVLPVPVP